MKKKTAQVIGSVAAALALSAGCSQSKVNDLNTELTKTQSDLADAKKAQREAEEERDIALAQAETATTNFRQMQATLADQKKPKEGEPKVTGNKPVTKNERFSYAVGMQIGGDFKNKEIEIEFNQFAEGVKTAYLANERLLSDAESKKVLDQVWKDYQDRERAKRASQGQITQKAGAEYLAANLKKPGVKATTSGLQYRIIKPGKGASPMTNDKAEVHYRGWTIDGNEFDSSYSRKKPSTFGITQVIAGWTEALSMMKPGAKWEVVVPQELAYGPGGKRPKIPPYSTLRFEVELLSVIKGSAPVVKKPVTSNIVRIPSQAEIKQGAKPEILTKEQEAELKKKNK